MDTIVKFFGNILAELIEKKVIIAAGIIRLAIKDAGKDPSLLKPKDLELVFKGALKNRLDRIDIANSSGICNQMLLKLRANHEIFVMSA